MKISMKKWLPSISRVIILLALITISIFQYGWISKSASTDISDLLKSIIKTIESRAALEFEKHPLLELQPAFVHSTKSEAEILGEIKTIYQDYGNNSQNGNGLSIYNINLDNGRSYSLYQSGQWQLMDSVPSQIPEILNRFMVPPRTDNLVVPDLINQDKIWIVFPVYQNESLLILFHADIKERYADMFDEFFQDNISDYDIRFFDYPPENYNVFIREKYSYSLINRKNWVTAIPYYIVLFPWDIQETRMMENPNLPMDESSRDLPSRNQPQRNPPPRDLSSRDMPPREAEISQNDFMPHIYVEILNNGTSLIAEKEKKYTIQWLLILTLLMSIGVAYYLILFQIVSLKKIRQREKEFIATITHELRTPLTVIQSAADNIESGILNHKKIMQYGNLITGQSKRLSSMIEGILLFSRLEGKAETPPLLREVDFSLLKQNLSVFATSLMGNSLNFISINFDDLPPSAMTDMETIELILTNLISNSNKHGYIDGAHGSIEVKGLLEGEDSLVFYVEDQGTGIEKIEKKDVFEPFFRGKKSLKHQVKGTGLGLFICSRKAKLLRGSLSLEKKNDRGCLFRLQLPYIPIKEDINR
ncbi:MAG: HAMP domain-containing sensor histidine kinase [Spirochaetaceae bacterium]|jgi:signal transduction histidine kinase|nr:HAMP domain-containing sensor histidine kinase [Spirochaetaceae bacterium]